MARIVYAVEHISYGDNDERTGWWLVRVTVADERGNGIGSGAITDRKPVARFENSTDGMFEARMIQEGARTGDLHVMPRDWKIADVGKLRNKS